jgi:hypothetical protein
MPMFPKKLDRDQGTKRCPLYNSYYRNSIIGGTRDICNEQGSYSPSCQIREVENAKRDKWPQGPSMSASSSAQVTLKQSPRAFLFLLSAINLGLGLLFYVAPLSVTSYWPWPVKELAVRFLGAIFLAISLGCWSAIQAKVWQRAKILVLVGGAFLGLTGLISLARGVTVGGSETIWIWTSYFLAAGAGCFILIIRYRWRRKQPMDSSKTIALTPSRVFFGVQTSVVGIFGAMMLLLPSVAQEQFWPWKVATPTLQTFGALFLATCLATGWAFFQRDPSRIIVLLPLDAIFPSLALLAVTLGRDTIAAESPSTLVTGVWVGLYSFVAGGSTILYFIIRRRGSAS